MTSLPPELLLPVRDGLPDAIAFLRASYPRPTWRAHGNFGEMSDFWLAVHASLREHGGRLTRATRALREGSVDARAFGRFFSPSLESFLQHLEGHHRIEDHAYFPRFRALDRHMVAGFDLLENDHEVIHAKLLASAASGRRLAIALGEGDDALRRAADAYADDSDRLLDWLLRHLSDEEDLVVPAMLEHTEEAVTG
jgi:hypothetical protein